MGLIIYHLIYAVLVDITDKSIILLRERETNLARLIFPNVCLHWEKIGYPKIT